MPDYLLDGGPILSGDYMEPLSGCWTADVTAKTGQGKYKKGSRVELSIAGVKRQGVVVSAGDPDERYVLRLSGGRGALADPLKVLEPRDYRGYSLDRVMGDVLTDAGEEPGDLSALKSVQLAHWNRGRTKPYVATKRLMRLAPTDVVLRSQPDGKIAAVKLTWPDYGAELNPRRVADWSAEDAAAFNGEDGNMRPGTAVLLRGVRRRVVRVQYLLEKEFRAILWFDDDSGADPLRTALKRIVTEVWAESNDVDFRALYGARVAKDYGDTVDVVFEDPDPARPPRLKFKSKIRKSLEVGTTEETWTKGTRVLVGWQYADERLPYVVGAWLGGGGLITRRTSYDGEMEWEGPAALFTGSPAPGAPLVDVKGDHRTEHDLAGGPPPTVEPNNPAVTSASVDGGDRAFEVFFATSTNLSAGAPLFNVTFGRTFLPAVPKIVAVLSSDGMPLQTASLVPGTSFSVFLGQVPSALASGNHRATFFTCA